MSYGILQTKQNVINLGRQGKLVIDSLETLERGMRIGAARAEDEWETATYQNPPSPSDEARRTGFVRDYLGDEFCWAYGHHSTLKPLLSEQDFDALIDKIIG